MNTSSKLNTKLAHGDIDIQYTYSNANCIYPLHLPVHRPEIIAMLCVPCNRVASKNVLLNTIHFHEIALLVDGK